MPAALAQGDESGTLIVAAKTSDGALLAVDGRVTRTLANGALVYITRPEDKLVYLPGKGACAIDGWLGWVDKNLSVADSLRLVAKQNGASNIEELFQKFLAEDERVWEQAQYIDGHYPNGRRTGDLINDLSCVGNDGVQPVLLIGQVGIAPHERTKEQFIQGQCVNFFYIRGFTSLEDFVDPEFGKGISLATPQERQHFEDLKQVRSVISSNMLAQASLRQFDLFAHPQVQDHHQCECRFNQASYAGWRVELLRPFILSLFSSVESRTNTVAKPNTIVLVNGRAVRKLALENDWGKLN